MSKASTKYSAQSYRTEMNERDRRTIMYIRIGVLLILLMLAFALVM